MSYITYSAIPRWWVTMTHALRWSTLRQFGGLPLMRAVMFAPVIAYLILFNDYVFEFLQQVTNNTGVHGIEIIEINNVYFLYYGLIFVGIASVIYSLSCPSSVAGFADSMSFARGVQETRANTVAMSFFDDVLEKFVQNGVYNEIREAADYPENTRLLTSRMVVEIYKVYLKEELRPAGSQGETSDQEDAWWRLHEEFFTGSGYFNADNIAERVYHAPKVIWAFTEPYRAIAAKSFVADISVAKYDIDDHSRVLIRVIVSVLYIGGFCLLFVPSFITFLKVSVGILR